MTRIILFICVGVTISQLVLLCLLYYFYIDVKTKIIPETLRQSTTSSRECWPNSTFCGDLLREPTWIPIDQRNSKFVFSAFYDPATNIIIIVGLNSRFYGGVCQIWHTSDNGTFLAKEEADIVIHKNLPETHGRRYILHYNQCSISIYLHISQNHNV